MWLGPLEGGQIHPSVAFPALALLPGVSRRHRGGRKDEKYYLEKRGQAICPKTHRHASSVGLLASDSILGQALQGSLLRNADAGHTFARHS